MTTREDAQGIPIRSAEQYRIPQVLWNISIPLAECWSIIESKGIAYDRLEPLKERNHPDLERWREAWHLDPELQNLARLSRADQRDALIGEYLGQTGGTAEESISEFECLDMQGEAWDLNIGVPFHSAIVRSGQSMNCAGLRTTPAQVQYELVRYAQEIGVSYLFKKPSGLLTLHLSVIPSVPLAGPDIFCPSCQGHTTGSFEHPLESIEARCVCGWIGHLKVTWQIEGNRGIAATVPNTWWCR